MRILVTGGAGFIASHVVDAYVKAGHHVAVVDNLSTGFRKNLNPKARFYKAEIRNAKTINRILKKERPEILNHHAAFISVAGSIRNPSLAFETNALGTVNLLSAFGAFGRSPHKKVIFSSTGGAMYGEPKKIPADETTPPLPISPYGLSKFLGEEIIRYYAREYGFSYCIFRYSNVYGPRQNPDGEGGVVAIFSSRMSRDKRPTIFGDGTKTRDYIYVGDVVRANLAAIKKGVNVTLNLASGKETSDRVVFDVIAKELGFKQEPLYASFRKGEVRRIALVARRAKKVLDWKPKTTFKEGIRKTIKTI